MTNKELQKLLKQFPDNARIWAGGGGISDEIEEDSIFVKTGITEEYMFSGSFNPEDVIEISFHVGDY